MTSLAALLIDYGYHKLDTPKRPRERHWPSDAGKCLRALVYQWRGQKPERIDGRLFFIFRDGNLHHEVILRQLEDAGVTVTMKEAPIRDPEQNLSGKMDALIKLDGKYYVLEIKSVNRYAFDDIMRDGPREDHVLQLQLYLHYVQNIFKIDTKQGIVLYKNKDTSRFCDYFIDYNESYVQDFFIRLKTIEEHIDKGTLPDRPYERSDWHCSYCEYQGACWAGAGIKPIPELTDEELTSLLGELIYAKQQRKEFEEKEDNLTRQVKEILKSRGIQTGKIGDYLVELKESVQRRLDQKKLAAEFGPKLNEFYKETSTTRLNIKEMQ